MGRLDVRICACRNLSDTQWISKPDPYCIVRIDNQKHKTTVKENNLNPEWNEVFKFVVADENSAQLHVEVWNHNVVTDELMGSYSLALNGLQQGVVRDEWFLLQRSRSNAEIRLRLLAHDFGKSGAGAASTTNASGSTAGTNAYPAPYQATGGQQPQQAPHGYPSQQQQQAPHGYPPPQQAPYQPQQRPSYSAPVNPMPQYGPPQPGYSGYPPQQQHAAYPMQPKQGAVPYQNVYYGSSQPSGYYPPAQPSGYYPPHQQQAPPASGYPQQPYGCPPQSSYQGAPVSGVPLGFGPQPPGGPYGGSPPPPGGPQAPHLGYPPPPMSYPQQPQGGGGCAPSW